MKAPDPLIAAYGNTTLDLNLRYPPMGKTVVPIELFNTNGVQLAKTDIVLSSELKPPYLIRKPECVNIQLIRGVSDGKWSTVIPAVELKESEPFIKKCSIKEGKRWFSTTMEVSEQDMRDSEELRRMHHINIQIKNKIWDEIKTNNPLKGFLCLEIADGSNLMIPWEITSSMPLALFYDRSTKVIRGVRRGGIHGNVSLRCIPVDSCQLDTSQFKAGQKIKAKIIETTSHPQTIIADYHVDGEDMSIELEVPDVTVHGL